MFIEYHSEVLLDMIRYCLIFELIFNHLLCGLQNFNNLINLFI